MDEVIRIPGTNFRIGLDPIIGLFPAVGDLLTGSVGLVLVLAGVGVALGGAAYLLRRIGPAIIAHAILNAVVMAVVLLQSPAGRAMIARRRSAVPAQAPASTGASS